MRYFLSVLLLSAFFCGIVGAETPISKNGYFCAKKGTVLHYERYAPDGKHWWKRFKNGNFSSDYDDLKAGEPIY